MNNFDSAKFEILAVGRKFEKGHFSRKRPCHCRDRKHSLRFDAPYEWSAWETQEAWKKYIDALSLHNSLMNYRSLLRRPLCCRGRNNQSPYVLLDIVNAPLWAEKRHGTTLGTNIGDIFVQILPVFLLCSKQGILSVSWKIHADRSTLLLFSRI